MSCRFDTTQRSVDNNRAKFKCLKTKTKKITRSTKWDFKTVKNHALLSALNTVSMFDECTETTPYSIVNINQISKIPLWMRLCLALVFFYTYLHAWARKKYIRLNPSVAKTYFSLEWCLNYHNHYFLIKTCLSCSFWSCCTFTPVSVRQTSHFQHRQCKTPPKVNSIRDVIWLKLERFPWLKKNSFSPPITGDKVLHVNVTMHNSWGYVMP